jgi:20S proteasome alpha/beta subunit
MLTRSQVLGRARPSALSDRVVARVTIAISLQVNDGVVLAADSASTLIGQDEQGQPTNVVNVSAGTSGRSSWR